jgi:sugar lactone lactonase YvrE
LFFLTETVLVDKPSNALYILDRYGYLYTSAIPDTASSEPLLHKIGYVGPGRPLGYHIHPHTGHLIICDSLKGLTQYNLETKALQILANQDEDGVPITYANDLDISDSTGKIYFTDSTKIPPAVNRAGFYDTMMSYVLTAMQGQGTGRLLVHTPAASLNTPLSAGTTKVLVDGLWFANGVALSSDDSYVLVAETAAKRVWKVFLKGEKAGTKSVLLDTLPGYPDGICRASPVTIDTESTNSSVDAFWVAVIVKDSPILKLIIKGGKHARWIASWLLQVIPPPVKPFGMVMKISGEAGEVLKVYRDPKGKVISGISGCQEVDNKLWLGHLSGNYVSYLEL